ncbi:MAG: hypothetical protein U0441_06855 [Polyangiaceae bacterium]
MSEPPRPPADSQSGPPADSQSGPPADSHSQTTAETARALVTAAAPITGIALVTFVLFKVLSLFVAPANVILCLLAIGHPLGVLVAARWYAGRHLDALRGFFVVACASVLALAALRGLSPTLVPPWISKGYPLGDVARLTGVSGALFMPLFVGSGAVEYVLFLRCRERTNGAGPAYGALLGGTLLGLLLGFLLLPFGGAVGLLALGLAALLGAGFGDGRKLALSLAGGAALFAVSAAIPAIDARFLVAVSPGGKYTARGAIDEGATLVHAAWDRQAYTQILSAGGRTMGAYDNLVYWDVPKKIAVTPGSKDDLVFRVVPEGARLAIIGVGGGRQMHQALALGRGLRVDGFDINETVVRYYQAHPEDNGGAFLADGARVFGRDGRRGVLESGPYDCVYLPEAGTVLGYYRTLAIDLNFLHTAEAYQGYADRLSKGGLLASAFASWADPGNYVTRRVAASFRAMGLSVRAYADDRWAVVLGARAGEGEALLRRADELAAQQGIGPLAEDTSPDIHLPGDDVGLNLLLAVASRDQITRMFGASMVAVGALAAAALVGLHRRARRGVTGGRDGAALILAAGLGASFLVVENAVILNLSRRLWNMADAVILGSALFLVCGALGAATAGALAGRRGETAARLGLLATGSLMIAIPAKDSAIVLAGALVLGTSSGSFFPALLDSKEVGATSRLYAADGMGALLGTLVVFFVPLLYGIGTLSVVAAGLCAAIGGGVVWLSRGFDGRRGVSEKSRGRAAGR